PRLWPAPQSTPFPYTTLFRSTGLRVEADHLRVGELVDERQRVAHGGQQDVAARLVRLRLDREAQIVPLADHVLAEQVEGLLHAVDRKSTRLNSSHVKISYAVF